MREREVTKKEEILQMHCTHLNLPFDFWDSETLLSAFSVISLFWKKGTVL